MPRTTTPAADPGLPEISRPPLLPDAVADLDQLSFADAEALFDSFWRARDAFSANRRLTEPRAEAEIEQLLDYVTWRLTDISNSLERRKPATAEETEIRARVLMKWGIECGEHLHVLASLLVDAAETETESSPASSSPVRGVAIVDRIDAVRRKALLLDLAATGCEGESEKRAAVGRDALFEGIDELGDMLERLSADVALGLQPRGGSNAGR